MRLLQGRRYVNCAIIAHIQHMAGARAKHVVHSRPIFFQQARRHKRLDRARKAAALQPPCAAAVQHPLRERQPKGDALLARIFCAVRILIVLE